MAQTGPQFLEQSKGGTVRKVDDNDADFDRATGEFECQADFLEDLNTDLIQMRLIIEASEEPPEVPEQAEPVKESVKDELEGKIIKYKKKLRMEKERIQSLEDQLAIRAQEVDQFRQQDQGERPPSEFITEVPNEVRLRELEEQLQASQLEKEEI